MLLDLGLPDMDGVEIITKVRSWSNMPIIVISARCEDRDKIEALDAGADDYITKPFSVEEFLARLRVTIRRINYVQTPHKENSIFVNGELKIDFYTKKNSLGKLRTAQRQLDVQRDVFLFNTRLQTVEESGDIARLRRALADDVRIVQLRRAVREAAESKLRNGVIDTNDLLRKITEEATAATARSAREIELVKTIYELKHTINR